MYIAVGDTRYIRKQQFLAEIISYLLDAVKITILVIYLLVFHFPMLCAPSLKKLLKRKKRQDQHQERQNRDYESLKERQNRDYESLKDCEPVENREPSKNSFQCSLYTGEFTTITQV